MDTRHTSPLATTKLPSTAAVSAIESAPNDTAQLASYFPDFTALIALAEHLLSRRDGLGDRIGEEVDALTKHRAWLRLHSAERARGVRAEAAVGAHCYTVQFAGHLYGTLVVAPDPLDSIVPAVPDAEARHLAHVCGAMLCLLEQAALLDVLSHHITSEPLQSLTPRQQEVLALIARGLSDDDIAEALHISSETLRRHRYDLYARLGVHDAHSLLLVAYSVRLGLVLRAWSIASCRVRSRWQSTLPGVGNLA